MISIGFGIERLGLWASAHPRAALALLVLLSAAAAVGLTRFESANSLSDLLRSDTPQYAAFGRLRADFPGSENDVLVAVSAPNLMQREAVERLRLLHLDLQFVKAVAGVTSMFSLRETAPVDGEAERLIPAELPEGAAFDALVRRVKAHPLAWGRLISAPKDGRQTALIIAALDPDVTEAAGLEETVAAVETAIDESAAGSGLSIGLTGVPVMQAEIRAASRRDRIVFNAVGFVVGLLVCLVFLRRPGLVALAVAPPVLSVFWAYGLLSLVGVTFNPLMNTIAPLILVIAFSDAMHLVFAVRRRLAAGEEVKSAINAAVTGTGPPCVLAALTTAVAIASLALTPSELITHFAIAASVATLLALVAVLLAVPAGARLLLDRAVRAPAPETSGIAGLTAACRALARMVASAPVALTATAVVALVAFGLAFSDLDPRYKLSEAVPDGGQSRAALEILESSLGVAVPIQAVARWKDDDALAREITGPTTAIHKALAETRGVTNVISVATLLARVRPVSGEMPDLSKLLDELPEALRDRLVGVGDRAALVTGYVPDLDAAEIRDIVARADAGLAQVRAAYPDTEIVLTGLPVLAAELTLEVMNQLKVSLLVAVGLVIVLIGLAFRSLRAFVASILPNTLAIGGTAALMWLLGWGLQYAGLVAMTVAFGLAADNTIHVLARERLEHAAGRMPGEALAVTLERIGPVLILTSVVLILGLAVTAFSDLPPNRIFGTLTMATLVVALVGDLIVLPASLAVAAKLLHKS